MAISELTISDSDVSLVELSATLTDNIEKPFALNLSLIKNDQICSTRQSNLRLHGQYMPITDRAWGVPVDGG